MLGILSNITCERMVCKADCSNGGSFGQSLLQSSRLVLHSLDRVQQLMPADVTTSEGGKGGIVQHRFTKSLSCSASLAELKRPGKVG